MAFIDLKELKKDVRSGKFWLSWLGITLGAFILAAGYVLFTNPYKIIPGGVYGLGRVLHHLIPSVPTGTFGLMLDIPLMITGIIVFGKAFGIKTIYAALITPLAMNGLTRVLGEDPYDGISFISQQINLADNVLLAAIFGGVLIGVGVGLILKFGATSGGTDIISLMLVKFAKIKFSSAILIVESVVVVTGMLVLQDWKLPLFSIVAIFVSSRAIDFVLDGASYDKLLFIITDKKEEMRDFIINNMERGGTYIKSKGMYTGNDKEIIFVVVNKREISTIKSKIKEVDRNSFVVIVDAQETFGDGFKAFPDKELI